jgi:transcriptional regulator with XRE-family HTH domain
MSRNAAIATTLAEVLWASKKKWDTARMAGIKKEQGPSSERVAAAVQHIRREHGLTYAELARRLAATGHPILDTGLMKIEKGTRRVDVDDLMALALALDTTPSRLLLPEVDYARPGKPVTLTPGAGPVRTDDAWAWAYGERPLGSKPASLADPGPAAGELTFIAGNRRHYFRGGFGWLGETSTWVTDGTPGDPASAGAKVKGAGIIAGAILGTFVRYGLDTRDIRQAAESAIAAALIQEEPAAAEQALHEVWAWLQAQGADDEEEAG